MWCNQVVRAAAEGFLDVATAALKSKKAAATGTGTGTGEVGVIDAAARRDIMAARLSSPKQRRDAEDDGGGGGGGGSGGGKGGGSTTSAVEYHSSFVSLMATLALAWTPSMVPTMAAHAAAALCIISLSSSNSNAARGVIGGGGIGGGDIGGGGIGGGEGVMRIALGLLTRWLWWFVFIGVVAIAGLGAAPRLVPPPVGGIPHDVVSAYDLAAHYAAAFAVFACSAASLALEGLAIGWLLRRMADLSGVGGGGGGGSRGGGKERSETEMRCSSSNHTERSHNLKEPITLGGGRRRRGGRVALLVAVTAAVCVVQPPLGVAIGVLARSWAAARWAAYEEGGPGCRRITVCGYEESSAGSAAALLRLLLSLQSAAMIAPSAVAVIQVLVESRGSLIHPLVSRLSAALI